MLLLLELYVSVLRILLLLLGVVVTLVLGDRVYLLLNSFLSGFYLPCIEFIAFLVIYVLPGALVYGAFVEKHFFKRETRHNIKIFLFSFLSGVGLALLPFSNTVFVSFQNPILNHSVLISSCVTPGYPLKIFELIGSGLVAVVFGFIGMDLGVLLKHASHKIHTRHFRVKKKKK